MNTAWRQLPGDHPARLLQSFTITVEAIADLRQWLQIQAQTYHLQWLLAHADDGINWGYLDTQGNLRLSRTALEAQRQADRDHAQTHPDIATALQVCPVLRVETLQQVRMFSAEAELLLWRDGNNAFHARVLQEPVPVEEADWLEAFDEPWMLWGTHGLPLPYGFTLWRDGAQGLLHAVPCTMQSGKDAQTRPPRLLVRHYLAKKEVFARVVMSRLVAITEETHI